MGAIISYVLGMNQEGAIWVRKCFKKYCCSLLFLSCRMINSHSVQYSFFDVKLACVLVTVYTVAGGMVSVAYTGES